MHAGLFTTDQPSALFPFHTLKDANIAAFRVQSRDGQTDQFLDALHILGRSHFTREVMLANLLLSPLALKTAIGWIAKKLRKENLLHSFCLILCMENRFADSTDPARWNDPLMKYQGINYRVSLLREAAFHGF